MAAYMLAPIADLNQFLLTTRVHPLVFPYPLLSTLHAARISLVYNALLHKARYTDKAAGKGVPKTTWTYNIVGFLIMCWGGGFIASYMLGVTPPQLLSIHPFINYVGIHLLLTASLRYISAPAAKTIDTTLVLLDGCLRTHAVIMSVTMAANSPVGAVQNSLLIQILCGTIGATGGGQLAGMLGIVSPHGWTFSTPPLLRATRIVDVIDILAAAICSVVFGATTLSHPSYQPWLAQIYDTKQGGRPLFSPTGARALCTLIFASAFAYRATVLHWLPATTIAASASAKASSKTRHSSKEEKVTMQGPVADAATQRNGTRTPSPSRRRRNVH